MSDLGHQVRRLRAARSGWGARSWLAVAVSRNPLIGRQHRYEAWVVVASVLLLVVAAVLSAGVGAAVYSARVEHYRAEKTSWTLVWAKATEFSAMPVDTHQSTHHVHACWLALGRQRCDTIDLHHPVTPGEQVPIWIDRQGQYLRTSDPARQALIDASITAFIMWCALAALIAAVTTSWWRTLARARDSGMDAELVLLFATEKGRGDHGPGQ